MDHKDVSCYYREVRTEVFCTSIHMICIPNLIKKKKKKVQSLASMSVKVSYLLTSMAIHFS